MKHYVLESYDYFGINYDVAMESALDTMKEKVGAIITKIKGLIDKFVNWLKSIVKKKINDIESKIEHGKTPQIQRQFATDSFGVIFKNKSFLEKPVRFIKLMDIQSDVDSVKTKVNNHIHSTEELIDATSDVVSKEYNSTDYVTINTSKVKELYETFDKFIGSLRRTIEQFSGDIELYSKHVTTMDEKSKSELLLYYNLSISCLNSNVKLVAHTQRLINHILSSIK